MANEWRGDTEGARADLRFARQYLEEWYALPPAQQTENTKNLDFALKSVAQARKKGPNVIVQIKNKDSTIITYSPDKIEAELLWIFGEMYTQPGIKRSKFRQGLQQLNRSLQLDRLPSTYVTLVQAHLNNNNRKQALETLELAKGNFPNNFDLQKMFDEIQVQQQPTNYRVLVISLACILLFSGAIILAFEPLTKVGPGHVTALLGLAMLGVGLIMKPAK